MNYLYIGLIVALTGIVLLFKVQNLDTVTVTLFRSSITLPMSALIVLVYVLGMTTGGSLLALVRSFVRGARHNSED